MACDPIVVCDLIRLGLSSRAGGALWGASAALGPTLIIRGAVLGLAGTAGGIALTGTAGEETTRCDMEGEETAEEGEDEERSEGGGGKENSPLLSSDSLRSGSDPDLRIGLMTLCICAPAEGILLWFLAGLFGGSLRWP